MDFTELTVSRRTVHSFKPDKVPDSVVEKALELSLWAPNHRLTFPWVYIWVGPRLRADLADLAVELKGAKEPLSDVKKKAVRETLTNPSHIILLGLKRGGEATREHEDFATLAASVQIASSYLWENGVGSKWTTSGYSRHARTYELAGVSPDEVRLEGAFLIGVPAVVPSASARPDLANVIRRTT
jgi:nitroreductase